MKYILDTKTIEAIEKLLNNNLRVELIPIKDGIKVVSVKRGTVKL